MSDINNLSASSGNQINLFSLAERHNSEANTLLRQAKNRMNELIERSDIAGAAGVKVNKDGSYEILSESKTDDAEKLKSAVQTTFGNDKTLNEILEKLKTASVAESAAASAKAASTDTQTTSQLHMLDANGDTVEISDEARARMQTLYDANKHLFEDKSDRVILNHTARTDSGLVTLTGLHEPQNDADSAFRRFTGYLLDDARAAGEYENDFQIGINENKELYVSGMTSKSGGEATGTAESEKTTLDAILADLNKAVKGNAGENESETLQSLRKFFEASDRYDSMANDQFLTGLVPSLTAGKFPFTLRTSHNMW